MKNKQSGLSLISLLIVGALLGFVFLIGMRVVPVVTEYMAVKRVINAIVESGGGPDVTVMDIRRDFDKRAYVQDVTTVTGQDLLVIKRGNQIEISVEYARKVPVAGNVSLLLEFKTDARRTGS
jgi:hypothetical protein